MELPFKVRNVKEIDEAVLKWSDPNYLLGKLERNKNLRGKEESSVSYSGETFRVWLFILASRSKF